MRIVKKCISDLLSAVYNPRKDLKPNDNEYKKLKVSIEQFGYVEPVIWNKRTGVVVGGHQRLKVLKEQGFEEIECVVVDLPEEKEKALNVALNKISGEWDSDKLTELFKDLELKDVDLTVTGFDDYEIESLLEDEDFGYFGDARERTYDSYRLNDYDETRVAGYYDFPMLKPCHYVPDDLIGFNYVKSVKEAPENCGVHFFLDDYQFERIWNDPIENFGRLKRFSCVLTPDFSLYLDMPMSMKIWNVYRSRLIGQMMQDAGAKVIPTLQWAEAETLKFCFDGFAR